MVQKTNSLERFWKELKRRKVVHVITVYAATAFVILELVDLVARPLQLPEWTEAFVIVILCIGFIIAVFVSWVYDITPAGVRKTKPASTVKHIDHTAAPTSSGWKIATYTGGVIIVALVVFNILTGNNRIHEGTQSEKSIAVLPFKLISDEPDKQYLADGMMDAITLHLSKIKDLRVISRTSVEQYRETNKTSRTIGQELDVTYLLEGSFQKFGDDAKLIVQLIKSNEESHVWGSEYKNKWKDVFSLQSEVAQTIASELNAVISPEEKRLIEKIPTENLEAYDYLLLGEHLRNQRTPQSLWKAKTFYEKSIEADPEFVSAYTSLAHCYGNLAFWASLRPSEAYPPALDLASKALKLDSLFADAYNIIGMVELYFNFDFVNAEKNYKRALELDPANLQTYRLLSELLFIKGEYSEALGMDRRAMVTDPIFILSSASYGAHLYYTHQKDSAISHLTKISEQDPSSHFDLGIIYFQEGEYEKSVEEIKKTLMGFSPISMTYLGIVYSKSGMLNETKKILDTLESRAKDEFVPYSMRGALMCELGQKKEALDYLRKGYDEKEEFLLLLINVDTISFSNLRKTPEFIEILGKMRVEK